MTDLSPSAQAVLDAVVLDAWGLRPQDVPRLTSEARQHAAAAIRAVADQVVPEKANAVGDEHDAARHDQWLRIRYKIIAIATELDGL